MDYKIWLSPPHLTGEEMGYLQDAIASNWIAPAGPNLDLFEDNIKSYLGGGKEIVALNSGTSALHLALVLLGINQGDEVLCQSLTFAASVNPILYLGAKPVFIDSESKTWNLCPEKLEEAIIDRIRIGKKPKALIAVHLYGMPYQVDRIQRLCDQYGIAIIEDSAEAIGSKVGDQLCGSFGSMGIFSFNGNKIITTSSGGALIVGNKKLKERAIYLATQSKEKAPHFEHSEIGYNYRLSNLLASIGIGQLKVLQDRVKKRRGNFDFYKNALKGHAFEFQEEPTNHFSNRWLTCVLTPSYEIREKLRSFFCKEGIETRPLWKPMHLQPVFKSFQCFKNGISEDLFNRGLCLPSGSKMSEKELNLVVNVLKNS